jgi:1D-myo-inositol-tetrakisphosphate 5-kinase/inositol-polyphosphate multikinase
MRTIQQSLLAIRKLKSVLEGLEMRFIGASILLVYEGDEEKLLQAFENADAGKVRGDGGEPDVAIVDDEDSEEEEDASVASDAESEVEEICPPITLRMIDFAHTWLVEGEGPDRGVLKGVETLEALVEGRLKALESSQE